MWHKGWTIPLTVTRLCSFRSSCSSANVPSTLSLLDELAQLIAKLRATSRRNEKFAIIKEHPSTHVLLRELAHDAPLHLGSRSLEMAMTEGGRDEREEDTRHGSNEDVAKGIANVPSPSEDLMKTLERLRSRELKGREAIHHIRSLMASFPQHRELLRDLFERRLRFGMGERLLERALNEAANEGGEQQEIVLTRGSPEYARHVVPTLPPRKSPSSSFPITSKELPVALGFPLQHPSVRLKSEPGVYWLMSRKLDGIRCLARVNRTGDKDDPAEIEGETATEAETGATVTLYSRAGRVLDHLKDVRQEVLEVARTLYRLYPDLGTFYLDGELCILKPPHGSASAPVLTPSASSSSLNSDGSLTSTGMDDFRTALSIVLSRPTEGLHVDAHRLNFFLFDLIDMVALEKVSLSERLARLEMAMAQSRRALTHRRVQLLPQHRTDDPLSFKSLLSEHWEGLIIRRDAPHLAKRTRDIIKVKDFYEAEFTIVDWRVEPMTVIREGRHVEETLLAAIKIQLAGNDVWVGSGLTQEERRRHATNPADLLGAQVTVRYFQESTNRKNDQVRSLRFPTIKAIHCGGGRTV